MTPQEFKAIRKAKNYTINTIADLIGVNERTIRRYEHGDTHIHKPVIILMKLIELGKYPA
jgi:transcriptional regulator with XRE-family HTH domain